jgi:cytidylate kinase
MSPIEGKPPIWPAPDAAGPAEGRGGGRRVITISASFGAGGSVVAPRLAERVGLPFADRLIPATPLAPPGIGGERLSQEERQESARASFLARLSHLTGGLGMPVPTAEDLGSRVQDEVETSIVTLARTTGGVILGRAAAIVLADDPAVFHVRLDGPEDRRIARAVQLGPIDEATARRQMTETDQARARYLKRLYGADPADPRLYHLVLDTTVMALDDCVELIAAAAVAFWRRAQQDPASPPGR